MLLQCACWPVRSDADAVWGGVLRELRLSGVAHRDRGARAMHIHLRVSACTPPRCRGELRESVKDAYGRTYGRT